MPTKKNTAKAAAKTTKKTAKKTAKKAATKKSAKKSSSKKATSKSSAKKTVRALVCADGKECFWTTDGQVLKDLDQLAMAFGSMADEVFLHHANTEKNDFADWVEDVLNDVACAAALRKARKPKTARTVVVRHLKNYSS